jgi:hypothetical protein
MSKEWFYKIDEHEHGPIESKTLKLLAEVGQITPSTLVRKAASKSWTKAYHVKQLFDAHTPSQQAIDTPPIIGQASDSEREKAVPVKPPSQVRVVTEPPPIISTAELAAPESDAFVPPINIVTTPNVNRAAKEGSLNHADDDNINNNSSKRPLTLVLTLVGLIILTIPTAWYLHSEPTTTSDDVTAQVSYPLTSTAPSHSKVINNVFTKQSQWVDPTNDQILFARDARLSITHVWINTRQTEQPILNIVIKIENRNISSELSLQRQFANQNATDRTIELSPYVPLIRLSTGDGHTLDSEAELVTRTVPKGSEISETYQIALTIEQTAELDHLLIAIPKAWFNKSGYWGFKIPHVMLTSVEPKETPVQIASDPNSDSGNFVTNQPKNVDNEKAVPNPLSDEKGKLPLPRIGNKTLEAIPKNGGQPENMAELKAAISVKESRSGPEVPQ